MKPFTPKMYADIILMMYNAGLENAYEQYSQRWARLNTETDTVFIRRAAEAEYQWNWQAKTCIYQDLIDQATTNERGEGVTLNKLDAVHTLKTGLPNGYHLMSKEIGVDEYWEALCDDDMEQVQKERRNKSYVLTCNGLDSYNEGVNT